MRHRLGQHARPQRGDLTGPTGLKIASILSFVIAGLFTLSLLFQILIAAMTPDLADTGQLTYAECVEMLNEPDSILVMSDCRALDDPDTSGPIIQRAVSLALFVGLGVTFFVIRKVRRRAALADPILQNEAAARIERWGFDPLTTQGPSYAWHESQGFNGYADRIEHMVRTGPSQRPQPSQLIQLQVPTPRPPSGRLPAEVNNVLASFQQENESLSR
ncbi:hypothetical protein [Nocardiopsis sp. NRRL B-16309]|uniref:hypothetical protein n=1 Tax=Nocardiopsis sp. NRRL B-16309 TaxID=1519494 RepID=UPI0012E1F947